VQAVDPAPSSEQAKVAGSEAEKAKPAAVDVENAVAHLDPGFFGKKPL